MLWWRYSAVASGVRVSLTPFLDQRASDTMTYDGVWQMDGGYFSLGNTRMLRGFERDLYHDQLIAARAVCSNT